MNHAIGSVLDVVLAAAGSQVAVLVPVALEVSVDRGRQRVAADVELATLVQKGPLNVLLNDVATPVAVHLLRLDQTLDVIEVTADLDATTTIGVLTWLDDPQIVAISRILLENFIARRVVVGLHELQELSVAFTLLNVVGEWNVVERILAQALVEDLHVVVDGLLVAQMEVVLLMVGRDHVMAGVVLFLLLFFIVSSMLALPTHIRASSDLLKRFIATG